MALLFNPLHYRLRRFIVKPLLAIVAVFALLFAVQALVSYIYVFEEPKPFEGDRFYNPYSQIDPNNWQRMNLHAHSKHWLGLTNGNATPEQVVEKYARMGYGVVGLSNYQSVSSTDVKGDFIEMPVYEHGFGYNKFHQLVINPQTVSWQDQLVYVNLSQKQYMLSVLRRDESLICFNHPAFTRGQTPDEMAYLRGYDLIEAASGMESSSMSYWDSALSAGIPSFVLANDDSHDVTNESEYGAFFTQIQGSRSMEGVLSSLRRGETVGVALRYPDGMTEDMKVDYMSRVVPSVDRFVVDSDTLTVSFSLPAKTVRFIGQWGEVRASVPDVASLVSYPLSMTDTYVRVEAEFEGGVTLYLNPVFRCAVIDEQAPLKAYHERPLTVDTGWTALYRSVCVLLIVFLYFMLRRIWKW